MWQEYPLHWKLHKRFFQWRRLKAFASRLARRQHQWNMWILTSHLISYSSSYFSTASILAPWDPTTDVCGFPPTPKMIAPNLIRLQEYLPPLPYYLRAYRHHRTDTRSHTTALMLFQIRILEMDRTCKPRRRSIGAPFICNGRMDHLSLEPVMLK